MHAITKINIYINNRFTCFGKVTTNHQKKKKTTNHQMVDQVLRSRNTSCFRVSPHDGNCVQRPEAGERINKR